MLYKDLCEYYERLESTTKNLEKRDIVSELLKDAKEEDIEELTLASMGRVFPISTDKDLGIAGKLMEEIISSAFGIPKSEVTEKYKDIGDL
ncbi:MAG: DNA ligase, partial [Candidatus Aenigmatarchaeota archaeon]